MVATKEKTTKTKDKIIEDITYGSGNQAIRRRVIYEYKSTKIMLELQSDSWKNQCYAKALALDGFDWKPIYSIPSTEMRTRTELAYYSDYRDEKAANAKREFERDVERLKKFIAEIL